MNRHAHEQRRRGAEPTGFTLVEVMIASFLLAMGMMAALAMQFTALDGFVNARDLTNASEIGERITSMMRVESQQWRDSGDLSSVSAPYDSQKSGYWNLDSLLNAVATNTWTWQTVFTEPVDPRLSDAGPRRYCVYLRGEEMDDPDKSGATSETGILRIQIAVVYPSGDRSFPATSSSGPAGACDGTLPNGDAITDLLNPPDPGGNAEPDYELAGYRVVHMGAIVTQRAFLSNRRSRGST